MRPRASSLVRFALLTLLVTHCDSSSSPAPAGPPCNTDQDCGPAEGCIGGVCTACTGPELPDSPDHCCSRQLGADGLCGCVADQQCLADTDCCNGDVCRTQTGLPGRVPGTCTSCQAPGTPCTANGQCCSNGCVNGTCTCYPLGTYTFASLAGRCCNGSSPTSGAQPNVVTCLAGAPASCTADWQCGEPCVNGRCCVDNGSAPPPGEPDPQSCCSGYAVPSGDCGPCDPCATSCSCPGDVCEAAPVGQPCTPGYPGACASGSCVNGVCG
jgi:hypothetical protein